MLILDFIRNMNSQIMERPQLAFLISKLVPSNKLIYGKEYRDKYRAINFDNAIDFKKVLNVVDFAFKSCTYYRSLYRDTIITNKSDFENKIEFINRDTIKKSINDLLSEKYKKHEYDLTTTGGTSGPPAAFYLPKNRFKKEYAFYNKIWSTKGFKNQFRGVIRNTRLKNCDFTVNPITKEVVFDGFRNEEEYLHTIYKTLVKYNIEFLQCYPTSAYQLAVFMKSQNLDTSFIKCLFLSSEIFLPHQKHLICSELGINTISVYGHSEKLVLAVDFNGNGKYKILDEYGYLELIDNQGIVIEEENKLGEIVGTTIDNFGMPLIRYKTGDYSSYSTYNKTDAIRILDGIQGRWTENKIYNHDGSFVTPTALNLHDELYSYINGLQYFQPEKGVLEVRIIENTEKFNSEIYKKIYKHYVERLSNASEVRILKVDRLEKNRNGKFSLLISAVN